MLLMLKPNMFDGLGNTSHVTHDTRDVTTNNEGHGGVSQLFIYCCHSWAGGDPGNIKAEYVSNVIQWSVSASTGGRGPTQDKVGFYLRNIPDTNPSFWQLLWSDTGSVIIIVSIFAACLSS